MRFKELDGLRGIAVLAVMAQHYLSWLPATGARHGWLGVDLFFVLSGFLITSILIRMRGQDNYFLVFYGRRALRIFPVYFLMLAIYLAVSILSGKPGTLALWGQYAFFYTSLFVGQPPELKFAVIAPVHLGLAVLWSLSVEELYYSFWAPIVRYATPRVFALILLAMIVAAPLFRFWLHTPDYPEFYTFYCRMDALAYGSVVALLMHARQQDIDKWKRFDRTFDALAIVVAVAALALWIPLKGAPSNRMIATVGLVLADVGLALLVFSVLRKSGQSSWWLSALRIQWLRSVGMVSFSLYLIHYPVLYIATRWVGAWELSRRSEAVVQTLVAAVLSFCIAYALWYAMESRILNWKDRHVPSNPAEPVFISARR
ncbi:acyltransferase family protein [Variovorax sp. LT1R16]|uniref:acyltransferase family protein n=1 Tax=Variovorax sp. LT1R16 TaxID=3443728 RepID=UPI003F4467B8